MADDDDDKTEDPTARRLQKEREKGNVPISTEVRTAALLLFALFIFLLYAGYFVHQMIRILTPVLDSVGEAHLDTPQAVSYVFYFVGRRIALLLLPLLGGFLALGIASNVLQVGFLWAVGALGIKLNRLSPLGGLKRIFSFKSLVDFVKNVIKVFLAMAVGYLAVYKMLPFFGRMLDMPVLKSMDRIQTAILLFLFAVVIYMFFFALADYVWQRYNYLKRLRMSRKDIKDEFKDTEGSPEIKARIRRIRMQRAQQNIAKAVSQASVLVTNPTHYAVALFYEEGMEAPRLTAKGEDFIALKMREIAAAAHVPIVENPPVARALHAAVEVDQMIPPEHYAAVAEIIRYIMSL